MTLPTELAATPTAPARDDIPSPRRATLIPFQHPAGKSAATQKPIVAKPEANHAATHSGACSGTP